jgi:allantoinase
VSETASASPSGGASGRGFDLVIRAPRVICPEGEAARSIGISDGRIVAVEPADAKLEADRVIELDDDVVVLPGVVDAHVHVCEPGNTEWEGFDSATRAAAAGGITTLVDMPLDNVPTTVSVAALETKREAAGGHCYVDVGFWGGAIPGNLDQMPPLRDHGVLGFKCFLVDSGTPDFPRLDITQLEQALRVAREVDLPLLVHAESEEAAAGFSPVHGRIYADYLASRPRGIENLAIAQLIEAARRTGGRAHVVHLSSSDALPMIASAQRDGVPITAESCPHYLSLSAEVIPDGATVFKCSPPIREESNRELLWQGLEKGIIDLVASDHSPCTVAMKLLESGDFGEAWGGITSIQLSLPVVWTQARARGLTLSDVARWMAERPAKLAGLSRKGRIAVGFDADFCVFAPNESFVVDPGTLLHRNQLTPYAGRRLMGVVRSTLLRGEPIDSQRPRGRLVARQSAMAAATPA